MKKQNKKGFTLVEIMIVVVIIGLLAAMAVPAFQKVRKTSQDKAITNNLRQLASGASQYFIESGLPTGTYADIVGAASNATAIRERITSLFIISSIIALMNYIPHLMKPASRGIVMDNAGI